MSATADTPGWQDITRTWGGHYTFTCDEEEHPGEPYGAHRKDGKGTVRAATHADLLDAIKDDAAARPFAKGASVPSEAGDAQ